MNKFIMLLAAAVLSTSAFAAKDPCATAAARLASATLRKDSDFVNYDAKDKATIHQVQTSKNTDGTYDVEIAFGLPQEDDGETVTAAYSVTTRRSGAECSATKAERTE